MFSLDGKNMKTCPLNRDRGSEINVAQHLSQRFDGVEGGSKIKILK